MSIIINTNIGAAVTSKNLATNQRQMDRTFERLSAGKKTINASDDAAGIAIAGKMEAQIRGLTMSIRHAKDGMSMAGASEGAMQGVANILQKMRELAVQSASGTASNADKDVLNLEMSNLVEEIESISSNTMFNRNQLLRGEQFTFYTDIFVDGGNITTVQADMAVTSLGVPAAIVNIGQSVAQTDLDDVVSAIDTALLSVDTKRAHLGAVSNRFGHIINNLQNVIDNTTRSKSVMIDADYSTEATELTRSSVLQQGATSMLAQANSQKNLVLSLFQ